MSIAITILLISVFSVWFAELNPLWAWLSRLPNPDPISSKELKENIAVARKRINRRFKPFDCPLCLAWWIGLTFFLISGTWYMAPIYGACCSLLAVWISKQLSK